MRDRTRVPPQLQTDTRINEWLRQVENQMRHSLAKHFQSALLDLHGVRHVQNLTAYLNWMDAYPLQLVLLAVQV